MSVYLIYLWLKCAMLIFYYGNFNLPLVYWDPVRFFHYFLTFFVNLRFKN